VAESNVDIVNRLFEAFARRDAKAIAELFDDEARFEPLSTSVAERRPYIGPEGVRRYMEDLGAAWDRFQVTISEVREDGDHVVALGRIYAAGTALSATIPRASCGGSGRGRSRLGRS
jgi:ketosteroid isomerase-like protein